MNSAPDTPHGVGCPIRTSTDQRLLAAPRGFSQRATSFIASWCQGIHRMPFSLLEHHRIVPQDEPTPCTGTIPRITPEHASHGSHARHTHTLVSEPATLAERQDMHPSGHTIPAIRSDAQARAPRDAPNLINPAKEPAAPTQTPTAPNVDGGTHPHPQVAAPNPTPPAIPPLVETPPGGDAPWWRRPWWRRPLVETIGFEPTTPCLQSRCSPS